VRKEEWCVSKITLLSTQLTVGRVMAAQSSDCIHGESRVSVLAGCNLHGKVSTTDMMKVETVSDWACDTKQSIH
jgi:hypothetical protein